MRQMKSYKSLEIHLEAMLLWILMTSASTVYAVVSLKWKGVKW